MKIHHALGVSLLVVSASARAEESAATPTPKCPAGTARAGAHAVLLAGNPAGALVTCTAKDGSVVSLFAFNDRGRGPSTTTRTRFDANGLPILVETTGNDYYKK